jgi:hypothetical protein
VAKLNAIAVMRLKPIRTQNSAETGSFYIRRTVSPALLLLSILPSCCRAQVYLNNLPVDHPAIRYFEETADDPVTWLAKQIESGKAGLSFDPKFGYLPDLLHRLDIDTDSQTLVFSKSSFQGTKISPTNPRAIYFNDQTAVGFVPGGNGLEVAAIDAKQGPILYSLNRDSAGKPVFKRQQSCLRCHQGPSTLGVAGLFVGSVFPNADGMPARDGAIVTDHRTPFEDRWGGWYVNATTGEQKDRANTVASSLDEPDGLDTGVGRNIRRIEGRFDSGNYLTPTSDIVALMTLEHQTQMINFLTRLNWEARILAYEKKTDHQLEDDIEATVEYMLFVDEAPIREPIEGVSTFTKRFPERGRRDGKGRSLRDFDLRTRMFRYPLSYMIYSPQFDALPDEVRGQLYQRLYAVLTARDKGGRFAKLTAPDRRAILEILEQTKPNLPAWWHRSAALESTGSGANTLIR